MISPHPTPAPCQWFPWLTAALDRGSMPRPSLPSFGAVPVPVRGRRTVTPRVRAAVALVLMPGLLTAPGCGGSPDRVFRNDVMSPRPPGIIVLQAEESSGPTVESWLHFRGAPKDIGLVLNSDHFTEVPQDRISFDFRALRPPSWWRPRALGPGLRAFECEDRSAQEPLWRKHLFVNQAGDEVYFLKFLYY